MKKNGCLTWIIGFFVVCLLIGLYSLAWIPAIGFIIYYLIKKDYSGTRKRNFIISIIIFITSLLLFIWGTNSSSLTDIQADWGKTTFDVSETVEVKITPTPSDAKIEKLTLSDNDIAKLKYKDGKAIVSFKKVGTATVTFTANDSIDSNAAKDEWIVTEGQQPAIISKELFESAQERFKATYKPVGKRPSSTYKHWLSGLLKCPDCGRTLTSTTMKRVNGEKYSYFSCYGYSKGKCKKPNGISSLVLEKEVLASIKEVLDTKDIVYELREYQPTEQFDERKAITEQLESLTGKEERIKASYREGIDTLEEYKANKAIIQKERESLEQQLKELKKAAHKSDQDPADSMLQKVRSVYDILISNNYTYVQKNEALKQIIDKIIYDRKNNSLKIYFFLYR